MERNDYLQGLEELAKAVASGSSINSALGKVCVHIGQVQARQLLSHGRPLALPSVKVKGAFWKLVSTDGVIRLRPDRIIEPYESLRKTGQLVAVESTEKPSYLQEALRFAEKNWPLSLVSDPAKFSGWFLICDPTVPSEGILGGCRVIAAGCATFSKTFQAIMAVNQDHRTRQVNDALLNHSILPFEREELRGAQPRLFRYCIHCGQGLHDTHCVGCRISFPRHAHSNHREFPLPGLLAAAWYRRGLSLPRGITR